MLTKQNPEQKDNLQTLGQSTRRIYWYHHPDSVVDSDHIWRRIALLVWK